MLYMTKRQAAEIAPDGTSEAPRTRRANGEGTLARQRPDGLYQIDLRWVDSVGRSRRGSVYGKTAPEARRKAKEMRDRVAGGSPARDAKMSLAAFTGDWVTGALPASNRKPSTREMYARTARMHIADCKLGAYPLNKLEPRFIETWIMELRKKGLSQSTVRTTYTILRSILEIAVRDGLIARNHAALIPRPIVDSNDDVRFLNATEVQNLLDAAAGRPVADPDTGQALIDPSTGRPYVTYETHFASVFAVLVHTGMRRGEALALRWADVDSEAGIIRVRGTLSRVDGELIVTSPKTKKSNRSIPMSKATRALFTDIAEAQRRDRKAAGSKWHKSDYVFTTEFGLPCDPRNALRALKAVALRAGLGRDIGLHTLRHTAATTMLIKGVPLKVVSDVLGHSSVSITGDIYGHVAPHVSLDALEKLSDAMALTEFSVGSDPVDLVVAQLLSGGTLTQDQRARILAAL